MNRPALPLALVLLVPLLSCPAENTFGAAQTQDLPFLCFAEIWDKDFEVSQPKYDKQKYQLSWTLEARDEVNLGKYEAFIGDGDGVEVDTVKVTFDPAKAQLEAGEKVKAIVSFRGLDWENIARITIRLRK